MKESKLRKLVREEARKMLSEAPEDYDMFEYKLREVRIDGITGRLTLAMKLYMAPENPSGELARNEVKDTLSDLRLDVNKVEFGDRKTMIVRLNEEILHVQTLRILMDEGITVDLS